MPVAKVIELVGNSERGWEDAVSNAVAEASKTLENISGVEVLNMTATVNAGEIVDYKVDVKVSFSVEENR